MKKNNEEITIPIYYAIINGEKTIDTDSMREEFEYKLERVAKGDMGRQELRVIIGAGAYKDGGNDYEGMVGRIEICGACCKGKYRIQFLGIGNNELLENFNLEKIEFFLTDEK